MWQDKGVTVVVRDVFLLVVGTIGVIHQELSGNVSVPLLVVYTGMMGVPGAAAALWLGRSDIGSASSPSARQESASPGGN